MPFIREKFTLDTPQKATIFLQKTLHITHKEAQRMIDKGRVENNDVIFLQKAGFLRGEVIVSYFKAESAGLKPIFETCDFAVFDKPAGLLSHPKGRFSHTSLLDSIRFYCGANANPINRLDSETSGVLLVSKNKKSEVVLKQLFEMRKVKKTYLAMIFGRIDIANLAQKLGKSIMIPHKSSIDSNDFIITLPLKEGIKGTDLGIRSFVDKNGKYAQTAIKILHYDSNRNITYLKVMPLSGRTHQIRVHLAHIGYRIVGETLYGVDDKNARDFLDNKISGNERERIFGANRLLLHAQSLRFCYNGNKFFICSKMPFIF